MKRKLLFFKTLAAASVIFALSVAGAGFYFMKGYNAPTSIANVMNEKEQSNSIGIDSENSPKDFQTKEKNVNAVVPSQMKEDLPRDSQTLSKNDNIAQRNAEILKPQNRDLNSVSSEIQNFSTSLSGHENPNNTSLVETRKGNTVQAKSSDNFDERAGTRKENVFAFTYDDGLAEKLIGSRKVAIDIKPTQNKNEQVVEVDPVQAMMARLDQREKELLQDGNERNKNNGEDLWTSVGFAAGSFNPVGPSVSPNTTNQLIASNTAIAKQEAKASGTAYSVGVNLGKRLANRWILQGGVNYLAQASEYETGAAFQNSTFSSFRPASINEMDELAQADAMATNTRAVTTAPYTVNNNLQFLSLPLQAGYLVVDKKFGLQLNAGVATDLFLHNTKSTDTQGMDKIDQGIGESSPYRSINFSGLAGTEFSYKFSQRYRLSLNPGVRYPFNSVYKSHLGVQSVPLTFDVGLRFRYIFQ
jgi:hypothetical protein